MQLGWVHVIRTHKATKNRQKAWTSQEGSEEPCKGL